MWIRLFVLTSVLFTSSLAYAQDAPDVSSTSLDEAPDDGLLPPPATPIDPAAMALFSASNVVIWGVYLGGVISMGLTAPSLDVQTGSALVGMGLIGGALIVASTVGMALGLTGRFDGLSRSPLWAWVGAGLAVLGAALAVTGVTDAAVHGFNDRVPAWMVGGTVATIAAPLVFNIGTDMFE